MTDINSDLSNFLNSMAMPLFKYCPSNNYIVRSSHKHLQLFWFVEDCLTFSIALVSRKQHVVHVLISPPPPSPIYNKTFSDQHWRYVQKYDHLDARFITVTYHIKAFMLFVIDLFCSEYGGPINNATFRKSPPFSIPENQVAISPTDISRKKRTASNSS